MTTRSATLPRESFGNPRRPCAGEPVPYETWSERLERLLAAMSPPETDRVPVDYVDAVTRGNREAGDSVHVLLMDLHRELNRLQTGIASESVDGAQV